MPVTSSDLKIKFSVKTGAAGDTTAGTAAGSLGKYISTTEVTDNTLHNLFDAVTGDENAASDVEYRCIFVHNISASTWNSAVAWVSSQDAGGATIAIGIDTTAASDADASSAQALEVANENTAPVGVSFSTPTTKGAGLALGSLAADECRAIWVRRTAANTSALDDDEFVLNVEGD